MYVHGESIERLRAMLSSADLAERMKAGGVLGKPEVTYVYGEEPQH